MTDIFVFGSNLAGRHGAGAALWARRHCGAIYGQGEGLQGQSYAIPTRDENINTLTLTEIKKGVDRFIAFALINPTLRFKLTRIGCGLAGYSDEQIAPMFWDAPSNCVMPDEWTGMTQWLEVIADAEQTVIDCENALAFDWASMPEPGRQEAQRLVRSGLHDLGTRLRAVLSRREEA